MTMYALDGPAGGDPALPKADTPGADARQAAAAAPAIPDAPPIAPPPPALRVAAPHATEHLAKHLAEANINPVTGLATDYLNHFNEAIMVLELIPSMPACIEDLMDWNVMTYREHFLATQQKHRDAVLSAYETADPQAREQLDQVVENMNAILTATRDALRLDLSATAAAALARDAAGMLKPLVARAGAVINGLNIDGDLPLSGVPQAAVDALMRR